MKYIRIKDFEIFLRDLIDLETKMTESEIPILRFLFAKIFGKLYESALYRNHIIIYEKPWRVYIPIDVFKALTTILEDNIYGDNVISESMKNNIILQIHKSRFETIKKKCDLINI